MELNKLSVPNFYEGKNIFITGGSGFLGKVIIEHLLRKCNVNKIYLLIRKKKMKEVEERVTKIFQVPLFDLLHTKKPNFLEKIEAIEGDALLPGLGLSDESKLLLIQNIHIVIHSTATVNFEENVRTSSLTNVRSVKDLSILCQQMKQLQSFVHVSTAYANCPYKTIEEKIVDPPLDADRYLEIVDSTDELVLNSILTKVLGKWPNIYSFTKALGENVVKKYASGLPVCVHRPAIVIGTISEPVQGWVDNLNGPTGFILGSSLGLIRVYQADFSTPMEYVPVDMVANSIIVAAYKTALDGPKPEPTVYNYATHPENKCYSQNAFDIIALTSYVYATSYVLWCPSCIPLSNGRVVSIVAVLQHLIPATLADIVLVVIRKKPWAVKLHVKISKFLRLVYYFSLRNWNFVMENTEQLYDILSEEDKRLFPFSQKSVSWDSLFDSMFKGIRKYVLKEPDDTLPKSRQRMLRLYVTHHMLKISFVGTVCYYLVPSIMSTGLQWLNLW